MHGINNFMIAERLFAYQERLTDCGYVRISNWDNYRKQLFVKYMTQYSKHLTANKERVNGKYREHSMVNTGND